MRAETLEFAPYEDHPALDAAGRRMLDFLREHPKAPRFHNRSGHRLLPEEVTAARDFERHECCIIGHIIGAVVTITTRPLRVNYGYGVFRPAE